MRSSKDSHAGNIQSPDLAKEMLQEIVAYKHSQLKLDHKALLLGFVLLVVNIIAILCGYPRSCQSNCLRGFLSKNIDVLSKLCD